MTRCGVGVSLGTVVQVMGRHAGWIAMHASLASRDVDVCLIPECNFYLEGEGGIFEFIGQRLRQNGHAVVVSCLESQSGWPFGNPLRRSRVELSRQCYNGAAR